MSLSEARSISEFDYVYYQTAGAVDRAMDQVHPHVIVFPSYILGVPWLALGFTPAIGLNRV